MGASLLSDGGDAQRMLDYGPDRKPGFFFARLHLQTPGYTASPTDVPWPWAPFPTVAMSAAGTVLVTGATGTVGGALVSLLANQGVAVRAVSRAGLAPDDVAGRVDATRVDLRDPRGVAEVLAGVDRLFLATPLEEDMAGVAARVVEQACQAGVRQVVRLSAFGAGGGASTRLAAIHEHTEECLRRTGIPWVFLRPNAFMQNTIGHFADSIRRYGSFRAPQGNGRVSAVDARDVAAVAARVLTQSPPVSGCFDLTGPEALSNHDIAAILGRVLGREIHYLDTEPGETRATLLAQGLSVWLTDIVMELYDLSSRGGAARVSPDVAAVLGRAPTSFERLRRRLRRGFPMTGARRRNAAPRAVSAILPR